jgi:tetratricopeptide (TPR) repeat protein
MEEAAGWYQSVGDLGSQASGELHLGVSLGWTGRLPEACVLLEMALTKIRQLGDRFYFAYGTGGLGVIHMHSGKYEQAALAFQEAFPIIRQDGYMREEAFFLAQTGCLAMVRIEPAQAIVVLEQSVASFRKMGFLSELGMALGGLALAQHLLKQKEQARDSLQESLCIAVETHGRFTLFTLPAALVVMLADDGRWEQALKAYSAVMTDPIVANSHWFADMIGDRIERAREQIPEDIRNAAEGRGREGNLFEVLGRLAKEIHT